MSTDTRLPQAVHALVRVSRIVEGAAGELGIADYRVLSIVAAGDSSPSLIAARLLLTRPTISATLDSLEARGLIVRSSVEGDARAVAVSLTTEGAAVRQRAETRMCRQFELLAERTPDADQLISTLARLDEVLEAVVLDRIGRTAALAESAQPK